MHKYVIDEGIDLTMRPEIYQTTHVCAKCSITRDTLLQTITTSHHTVWKLRDTARTAYTVCAYCTVHADARGIR